VFRLLGHSYHSAVKDADRSHMPPIRNEKAKHVLVAIPS